MSAATPRIDFSSACRPVAWRFFCCWRARTRTSPPAATLPTTIAAAGRPQLRGSRMAESSQSASSVAAATVSSANPRSRRSLSASGGSIGTSALRSSCSTRSLIAAVQALLELLDGSVDQDLRGSLGSPERARDLAVVHAERKAHDKRLASVLRQLRHALEHLLHLLAALHELLRAERLVQDARIVQLRDRTARAVAVEVRGEVVRDADQPRPERPPGRLALGALEVAVSLEEGLLREVFRVVVIAHPVVGVGVDVAEMRLVEIGEVAVEPLLVGHCLHSARSLPPRLRRVGTAPGRSCGADALEPLIGRGVAVEHAAQAGGHRGVDALALERARQERDGRQRLRRLVQRRLDLTGRHAGADQLAGAAGWGGPPAPRGPA